MSTSQLPPMTSSNSSEPLEQRLDEEHTRLIRWRDLLEKTQEKENKQIRELEVEYAEVAQEQRELEELLHQIQQYRRSLSTVLQQSYQLTK